MPAQVPAGGRVATTGRGTNMQATAALFEAAGAAAAEAARRAGGFVDFWHRIAGRTVRFRFAGPALVDPLAPTFAHLRCEPASSADLTIHAWDSETTGVAMPAPPWDMDRYRLCGEMAEFIDDRYYTHLDAPLHALNLVDQRHDLAWYWIRSPAMLPWWEMSLPFRPILHAWMSRRGLHLVHAGAVGLPDRGALLVGHKGAGKSTTALACLDSELLLAADDHCLVGALPEPAIHGIYSSAKAFNDDLHLYPVLADPAARSTKTDLGKSVFYLNDVMPQRLSAGFPLAVLLLPRVTGSAETTIEPAPPALALKTLAPFSMMRWPSAAQPTFESLRRIVRERPCYYLNAGTDLRRLTAAIAALLRHG